MNLLDALTKTYLYPANQIKVTKFGAVVIGPTGVPYLAVTDVGNRPVDDVIELVTSAITSERTIGLFAAFSEGKLVRALRRRFAAQGWDDIAELEYYSGRSASSKTLFTLPISNELEDLFFDIHSEMRDIDGMHPDEALEELCKLIYTRSYEEENAKGGDGYKLSSDHFGTNEECAAAIRGVYAEAVEYDLRVFRLKIPQYERSRGVFNQPFRLSSAALTRCYRMLGDFDLSGSNTDVKGRAFQRVLGKGVRSTMGQYFTPNPVCGLMAEIVDPKVSDLILDPFCGSGHFLTECLKRVAADEGKESKAFHEFAFGKLHGIEKSERMVRVAMTDMRLNGDGHSNIRCTDALLDFSNYPDIAPDSFDIIITNPPFGSLLGPEALATLGKFELAAGKKNSPLEIIGLERSIQFLRPGGRLAILLPDTVFSADSTRSVRSWLLEYITPRVIISLPVETFSPFGANVKTSILFGRKLRTGEKRDDLRKVLMVQTENIGYDSTGRAILGTDLREVVATTKAFLEEERW